MFFLIYLVVFLILIVASWIPGLARNKIGITEVIPAIWKSTQKILSLTEGNGLSIIALAFLLYALLQSKSIQALFVSKRKWLQKKRFTTIAIITITASLLASTLWWADEFIHFYPLFVPLLLSMGFDIFSSILCLYGGSVVGIIGSISSEGHQFMSRLVNPQANTHLTGNEGMWFRVIIWIILTTILVFFNIWYCNKIQKKSSLPNKEAPPEKIPAFDWRKKIALFFAFFFILVSILMSLGRFVEKTEKISNNIPEWVCSQEEKKEYVDLGEVKFSSDSSGKKNAIEIAEIKKKKESSWGGKWENPQKTYWFTIGGIIICLIAKLKIIETLILAITKSAPIIVIYIFSFTVNTLLAAMKLQIKPPSFLTNNRLVVLPVLFLVFFAFYFFSISIARSFLPLMAKSLKSLSTNTLAYSIIVMYVARFFACGISPLEGNLQTTLQTNKLTYKQYIKKTWVLWIIIFFVCLILISILPFLIDRGSG